MNNIGATQSPQMDKELEIDREQGNNKPKH